MALNVLKLGVLRGRLSALRESREASETIRDTKRFFSCINKVILKVSIVQQQITEKLKNS